MLFLKAFLIILVLAFGSAVMVFSAVYLAAFCVAHPEYVFGRFRRGASFDEEELL